MKSRYLITAGALTFILGLLLQAPAALLYAWTAPKLASPVQLLGISGTLARGHVEQLRYNNQPFAASLDWTLSPLQLLFARLRYQLHSDKTPLILDGRISQGLGGTSVQALQANAELRAIAAAIGQAFLPLDGTVNIDLASLQLRDGWPRSADGTVRLSGLAWTLGKQPVALGDFQAQLRTEDDQIIAEISSLAGNIDVNGEARVRADRSYDYSLKLKPKAGAPPMIANLMQQLGQPDAQGYYELKRSGSAPQPEPQLEPALTAPIDGTAPAPSIPSAGRPSNPAQRGVPPAANPPAAPASQDDEGLTFGGSH